MRAASLILALVIGVGLAACATSPAPRGYGGGHGDRYGHAPRCADCGVVERIERVYGERQSTGAGAIIGGVIGGVLGNQVGGGDGRRAATAAGAIAGGIAGNAIERDMRSAPRYEIFVRLDDGRRIVLTQRELGGLREGQPVQVRGRRAYPI